MDQKVLREREARCVQENPPGCTTQCPLHVDIRGLVASVRKGEYGVGFKLFYKHVPFPGIISRVCSQPCRQGCTRSSIDEPILINQLERICVDYANDPAPLFQVLPQKYKKVAVVGSGLSGLTVALELTRKGYTVEIFEASNGIGGSIWEFDEKILPREIIKNDLKIFAQLAIEIHLNTAVGEREGSGKSFASLLEENDAIYLGIGYQGREGTCLGLDTVSGKTVIDQVTLATSHPKVFAGGSFRLDGFPITAITDGKMAANSIDRLMQNASLTANREKEGSYPTLLITNIAGVEKKNKVTVSNPLGGYSKEEAIEEANRCLLCECRECVKACEYLAHFGSYPKRYVREAYNNLSIVMGIRHANKLINSCSLCGLCAHICPGKLDMGEVCREARQLMVQRGKMPPSAHEFALRDMTFSNSEAFALWRHQPGYFVSNSVFFPGCQHAASSPRAVQKMYEFLTKKIDGGVGVMLGCCGAPANWAGREELFQETVSGLAANWRRLGSPKVITSCPTCFMMLQQNLPELPVEMLWTVLDRIGLPEEAGWSHAPQKLAVHDSCTTRFDTELHKSVRSILKKLGHQLEELTFSQDNTVCCGYGGLMLYANPEVAGKVIARRINESKTDYLAYCAMCRDNFASRGKRAYYLLDLLFPPKGDGLSEKGVPGYSERQENRARLKISLLRDVWGENIQDPEVIVKVLISENVQRLLDEKRILTEDVTAVIAHAENTGDKLQDLESGRLIAYFRPTSVTYWVEYTPQNDGFLVHNAYSHRIQILE